MKLICFIITCFLYVQIAASERIQVVATYPYIADIVEKIGTDRVRVIPLARGDYNPHVIIPKPSYISKLRRADLLVINGAQLEIGWLPPILKQANNGNIQPGEKGFLDLSTYIHLIDVPANVSREQGDVHPEGNPHFHLNPDNIPLIAKAITDKLCEIEPESNSLFQSNFVEFNKTWKQKMKEWEEKMKPMKGVKVVEYHKNYDYFLQKFGLIIAQTVEPLPGIPPTTKHIEHVEKVIEHEKIRFILQDVYNPQDASEYLAKKLGIKMIIFPHDIGSVKEVEGIISLYDEMVRRITQ
ncbi:MAG: zinc ABC transporter substrate-binding protein [Bacteroidetes bacterium]|nr:zinc ABC transporter substrate-binding protein [Bacteroidota bacterium]